MDDLVKDQPFKDYRTDPYDATEQPVVELAEAIVGQPGNDETIAAINRLADRLVTTMASTSVIVRPNINIPQGADVDVMSAALAGLASRLDDFGDFVGNASDIAVRSDSRAFVASLVAAVSLAVSAVSAVTLLIF